ncbi:MAG: PEP-CTERM sorting domain-containing protein [Verrucomicrobiales bacterium]|jgi:hypothetical protein|nr:PEP-CTERM sorting domain-containing protein [Verrucomicrobiales bacterium]
MLISINIIAWTRKIYTIRQFGNSAIRQFGNSAIRQFGNSLNRSLTLAFVSALALMVSVITASAQWIGPGTGGDFFNTANWLNYDINYEFTGTNADGGYGWTGASNVYGFQSQTAVFDSNHFTYRNTDAVNFNLQQLGKLTLQGPGDTFTFTVDMGSATAPTSQAFTIGGHGSWGGTLDFNNKNVVFDISPSLSGTILSNSVTDKVNFYNTGTNIGSLVKRGQGILMLDGVEQFRFIVSGSVSVEEGLLYLAINNLNNPDMAPRISGATSYNVHQRAAIYLDAAGNIASLAGTTNLINNAPINLYGASLAARIASNNNGPHDQTVGAVHLRSGLSVIANQGGVINEATPVTLTLASLERHNYALVNFIGNDNGAGSFIKITNDSNIITALVGGTTSDALTPGKVGTGITNLKILPWATHRAGVDSSYNQGWVMGGDAYNADTMVTYSAVTGIRQLRDNEFYDTSVTDNTLANAADDDNVWLGGNSQGVNTVLSADKTINSMRVTQWNNRLYFQNNSTLTVTSGLIISGRAGGMNIGYSDSTNASGAISSGDREMIITGINGMSFWVPIINELDPADNSVAGLIIGVQDGASLIFNSYNNYGGKTIVEGGVTLKHGAALPSTTALHIGDFGSVQINYAIGPAQLRVQKLTGSGTLNFDAAATGNLIIGTASADAGKFDYDSRTVSVDDGFAIAPGDANAMPLGTLTFGANVADIAFLAGSFLDMDLAAGGLGDSLAALGSATSLTFLDGANLRLNFLDGLAAADGDSWILATNFNNLIGNLDQVNILDQADSSLTGWSLLFDSNSLLLSYAIPEPSAWVLLLTGVGLLAILRRRR